MVSNHDFRIMVSRLTKWRETIIFLFKNNIFLREKFLCPSIFMFENITIKK